MEGEPSEVEAWLDMHREVLSARICNCIGSDIGGAYGLKTLADLHDRTDAEWLRIPNFGRKALNELRVVLPHKDHRPNVERDATALVAMLRRKAEGYEELAKDIRQLADKLEQKHARA